MEWPCRDVLARVFAGAMDLIIPAAGDEEMVKALKVAGGELKFTAQPGAGPDGDQSGCNFIKGVYIDDPIGIAERGSRCRR